MKINLFWEFIKALIIVVSIFGFIIGIAILWIYVMIFI